MSTPNTPAGWYPDNANPGTERFWDGGQWTAQSRPTGTGTGAPMSKQDAKAQAAAAKAYSKAQRNWFARHKILTALGALIVVGIIATATGGGGSDTTNTANDTTAGTTGATGATNNEPQKPAIVTTSKAMIDLLEGNALKAKNTYEDKQVRVTGYVGNIDASGKYFSLLPSADAFIITGIQVQTGKEFKNQVANFSKGQKITVSGKITNVGEILGYSLDAETIT